MTNRNEMTDFERGAREGAGAMRLYFCDENEAPIYAGLGSTDLDQFEDGAIFGALADEESRSVRKALNDIAAHPVDAATDRDALVAVLALIGDAERGDMRDPAQVIADALIAAGYRREPASTWQQHDLTVPK